MTMLYVGAGNTPSAGPTQGILNWKSYVMGRWPGGVDLGVFVVRPVRGGSALSVHAVGRAWDWRYASPGPGRQAAEAATAFAIDHHDVLGIQAIHDYVAGRIWRCSRGQQGPAWKQQPPGNGMGDPSAAWLHWEVHPASVLHNRDVASVLRESGVGVPVVGAIAPAAPAAPSFPAPTLRQAGDRGANVTQLQQALGFWTYYLAKIDGDFGPKTEEAVKTLQRAQQQSGAGAVDGIYGPRTHAAADQLSSGPSEEAVA